MSLPERMCSSGQVMNDEWKTPSLRAMGSCHSERSEESSSLRTITLEIICVNL